MAFRNQPKVPETPADIGLTGTPADVGLSEDLASITTHGFGSSSQTTNAGGRINIPHGLGVVPTWAVVEAENSAHYAAASLALSDATNLAVFVRNLTAAGAPVLASTAVTIRWEART